MGRIPKSAPSPFAPSSSIIPAPAPATASPHPPATLPTSPMSNFAADSPEIPRPPPPNRDRKVIEFVRDSEVLILDSQYTAAEYQQHIGWGHSCFEDSVAVALKAGVKRLFLFHHDSDHADAEVSQILERARQIAVRGGSPLLIEAAREGFELVLTKP